MTHDPLCDWRPCTCPLDYDVPERGHMIGCPEDDCECEIIAKVRAHEAHMAANRICFVDVVARGEVYEDAWIRRNDAIMEAGRGEDVGFLRQFGLEPTREDYDRQRAIAAELTRMAQEDGLIP